MQGFIEVISAWFGDVWIPVLGVSAIILILSAWVKVSETETYLRWRIKINPKNADTHLRLGNLLAEVDEYEDAEEEFRRAIELNPKARQGYYQLFGLQSGQKQLPGAEQTLLKILELFPEDPTGYSWMGWLLRDRDPKKAEENFLKATSLAPRASFALSEFGKFLTKEKRFDEAEVVLRKAAKSIPAAPDIHLDLADLFVQIGQNEKAEKEYEAFIKLEPKNKHGYFKYVQFLQVQKRGPDAEKVIRDLIKTDSNSPLHHLLLGAHFYDFKQYSEAETAYRQVIEMDPDNAGAFYNLGLLLSDQKRYAEVEPYYRKAIEKDPKMGRAYQNLGWLLHTKFKKFNEAEIAYRKAIELEPSDFQAYHNLGNLLRFTKKEEGALSIFQKALDLDTKDFIALMEIASIQRNLGNNKKSKESAEKSRSLIPQDESFWYNMACLETILGNTEIAFKNLSRATNESKFDKAWAWEDPDLQWIRDDPRFVQIVGPKPDEENSEM